MKVILASALAVSMLFAAGAAAARPHHPRHPHKVCSVRHHHRVCAWVR